jgi:HlyD family secretion protein
MPGHVFHGVVARNAASLAVGSRTLPVEVDVRNDAHLLHPGLFVNVTLDIPRVSPGVIVPAGAILFSGEGLLVVAVENEDTVKMRDVAIYRDFGTSVECERASGEASALSSTLRPICRTVSGCTFAEPFKRRVGMERPMT